MKRILSAFIALTTALLWTGCSVPSNENNSLVSEHSSLGLQDNSLMPYEFLQEDAYETLNYDYQHAMWFAYMDYEKILKDKTEEEFTKAITERFAKAKSIGINTLYVQVRAFCDAYYKSDIFPKAASFDETQDFDPLDIMVKSAHSLQLSIHAWINPLRAQTDEEMQKLDSKFLIKQWYDDNTKKETLLGLVNGRWYLNPAYEEVRKFVADGTTEIVAKYQVDGIHIDDYFYPTTEETFDSSAFTETGNQQNLADWRRNNINSMVKEMYQSIKKINRNVLFGISPQGNINSNFNIQYADVAKWSSENGFCDYIVPQIYFGFKNENCPFESSLNDWNKLVTSNSVKLIIGLCTYKIGNEDKWAGTGKDEWITDNEIVSREVSLVKSNDSFNGIAIYSYGSTFEPENPDAEEKLKKEKENIKNTLLN